MTWMDWLDRRLGALLVVAAILGAGGVVWAALDGAPVPSPGSVELPGPGTRALVLLYAQSAKPVLLADSGRELLEISAGASSVRVNGEERSLHDLRFNAATDGEDVYLSWSAPAYTLEEHLRFEGDALVAEWSWIRAPAAGPQQVELRLAHYAYHVHGLALDGERLTYAVSLQDPRGVPLDRQPVGSHRVEMRLDRAPRDIDAPVNAQGNMEHFRLAFGLDDAPAGARAPIVTERIRHERSPEGIPPPAAPPAPAPDPLRPLAETMRTLRAPDGTTATFLVTSGAGKPLLVSPGGRTLMDVSGWESVLAVNGERRALAHVAYDLASNGTTLVARWRDVGWTLEERVEVLAEDGLAAMRIRWTWTRDADAPAQDVMLEVAHFGHYMRDAVASPGEARWRLDREDPRQTPPGPEDPAILMRLLSAPAVLPAFGATPEGNADALRLRVEREDLPAGTPTVLLEETILVGRDA